MPILITPGSGVRDLDADELNATLEAVASGGDLSAQQAALANSLQAPTEGNVFSEGPQDPSAVKEVTGGTTPAIPLPQTLTSGNSSASRDIQGFLGSLRPSETGQAQGTARDRISVSGAPLGGSFDTAGLQNLLFPQATRPGTVGQPGLTSFADPDKIEQTENLQLDVDFARLQEERANQILRDQVKSGIIPGAAKVRNRLGNPIVDLDAIGLTREQTDPQRSTRADLFGSSRPKSLIGSPRLSSIIGR